MNSFLYSNIKTLHSFASLSMHALLFLREHTGSYFRREMSCCSKNVAAHGNGRTCFAMIFQTFEILANSMSFIVLKTYWKRGIQQAFSRTKRSKYGLCSLAGNSKVANGDGQHWPATAVKGAREGLGPWGLEGGLGGPQNTKKNKRTKKKTKKQQKHQYF